MGPHLKIVGHGLRALVNIARLAGRRAELCAQPGSLATLVDLVQANRDKAAHGLLWDVLHLLSELVRSGSSAEHVKGADYVRRLESVLRRLETMRDNKAKG